MKKMAPIGPPNESLSLLVEVQIEYDRDALLFFESEDCSEDLGFQLVYFCFGFLFDQLSYARIHGTAIPDSHLRNIFVKDRKFY